MKLRLRRTIRSMSLQEVATTADISIGLLSEIERGIATPTLKVLRGICQALDMPIGWLFSEAETDEADHVVVRRNSRRRMNLGPSGMLKELMTPDTVQDLQMMRIVIEPEGTSGEKPTTEQPGAKCGMVVSGKLGLRVDGRECTLEAGDSFAFKASASLQFWCVGERPVELIWVVTPAMY
ncbi:MAG: cupin domain-containing protein [Proteobacteria bacterium]|nr:cupin domain-containing protein [Pseudomonadota bacterium]